MGKCLHLNIYTYSLVPVKCKILLHTIFLYKQPVYKQLGLDLQKVKKLLGLKHVTISNFANKIFAYKKHCDYIT